MRVVWRLRLFVDGEYTDRIDCYEFDDLRQFKYVVDGQETLDEYPEVFAVGNHIKQNSKPEIYEITKVLTQNGSVETFVDVTCTKV